MNASMLSYILFSCLLLSVQAKNCPAREIIRHADHLIKNGSVSCQCMQSAVSSCSCLPIPEHGHELACFVDGTKHLKENNDPSNPEITRLYGTLQSLLDKKLCDSLAHDNQCQYETKGNAEEFLNKIKTTFQAIEKFNA